MGWGRTTTQPNSLRCFLPDLTGWRGTGRPDLPRLYRAPQAGASFGTRPARMLVATRQTARTEHGGCFTISKSSTYRRSQVSPRHYALSAHMRPPHGTSIIDVSTRAPGNRQPGVVALAHPFAKVDCIGESCWSTRMFRATMGRAGRFTQAVSASTTSRPDEAPPDRPLPVAGSHVSFGRRLRLHSSGKSAMSANLVISTRGPDPARASRKWWMPGNGAAGGRPRPAWGAGTAFIIPRRGNRLYTSYWHGAS